MGERLSTMYFSASLSPLSVTSGRGLGHTSAASGCGSPSRSCEALSLVRFVLNPALRFDGLSPLYYADTGDWTVKLCAHLVIHGSCLLERRSASA
jgi:hypothetical protein